MNLDNLELVIAVPTMWEGIYRWTQVHEILSSIEVLVRS